MDALGIDPIPDPNWIAGTEGNQVSRGLTPERKQDLANFMVYHMDIKDPWLYIEAESFEEKEYRIGMNCRLMWSLSP